MCISGFVLIIIGAIIPVFTHNMVILCISRGLAGLGTGAAGCVLPGMLQDSITYAQWQSKKNVLGMGNAAYSFCNKIGASLGTILMRFLLDAGGFDGTLSAQPEGAITAINVLYIWIPVIMTGIAIISMTFYDLDKKYNQIADDFKNEMSENVD